MTLTETALTVLLGLLLLTGTLAPLILFAVNEVRDTDDDTPGPRWQLWALTALISFASITAGAYLIGHTRDDEAAHCAPGTRYVRQDHLVGKTIDHDWICTPD